MEILRSDPKEEELAVIEEDDEFYEDIEAPKFVDFTVPDRSRPDDKSWFCLRIGCDQQHEEVDPDALYRSFWLRVMSARSPNVKLHKALNRPAPRSIRQCPRSAPAKSVKDRVSRLSTMTSVPDKVANTLLNYHPISSLRSTPTSTKARVKASVSEKKALTTPRTRKGLSNHEPFRSVKHQKERIAATKNGSVSKALFLGTPKKNDEVVNCSKPVMSEVCDGMKKLNIGTGKKKTPVGCPCKSNKCTACNPNCLEVRGKQGEETTCVSSKKRIDHQEIEISNTSSYHSEVETTIEENLPRSSALTVKELQQSEERDSRSSISHEEDKENNFVIQASSEPDTQAGVVDSVVGSDDNKENDSSTSNSNSSATNSENGSLQFRTTENIPQKEIRAPSKKIQVHATQAGKVKRTTNPKPFRLRTDERGILKEANLEKKIQLEARKETLPVLRRGDGMQQNGKPTNEKNQQTSSDGGQKAQPNQTRAPRVRFVESRYATSIPKGRKVEKKEQESQKMIVKAASSRQQESQKMIVKAASSRQTLKAQSATATRKVKFSQLREKGALVTQTRVEDNNTVNVTCPKGKRPSTIARKSTVPRFHVPKNCTKRPETTMP